MLCIPPSEISSGARVKVTARMITPPSAPNWLEVTLSNTGKPISRIALALAAVIEWAAPRRNVAVPPGISSQAAARAVGEAISMSSHATAPAAVAHKNPARPHPITNAATATAIRMTASVTISAPY